MLLWFHLVIPSFPARIDDMRSRFSALSYAGGLGRVEIGLQKLAGLVEYIMLRKV